jgi:biopolymer transport protein ExbB
MSDFLETMRQGGWPMIPLSFFSIAAVAIVLERAAVLRRDRVIAPDVVRTLHEYGTPDGASASHALAVCQRAPGAYARVAEELLQLRHLEHTQLLETMHAVGRTHVARLERGLTILEIIANVSPLLGLLGTVLGMIDMFDALSAQGLGNPQVLAAGIAKALITTVAGLCVAIPAMAFHGIYSKRVDDLSIEMQERATAFLAKLHTPSA